MEPRSCHIARAEHRNAGGVPLGQEMMASDHGKQEAARQGAHKAPTQCCLYPEAAPSSDAHLRAQTLTLTLTLITDTDLNAVLAEQALLDLQSLL